MSVVAPGVLRLMQVEDLPWVMEHEPRIYPYPWSEANFADSLSAGYLCRVLEVDGVPVGYGVMMLVLDEAHLLNLSVIATEQGKGLGRQLLSRLCDEARTHGASQCFLEVRPSNVNAHRLYTAFGFVDIARRRGYYPAAGGREDAIVMRVAL